MDTTNKFLLAGLIGFEVVVVLVLFNHLQNRSKNMAEVVNNREIAKLERADRIRVSGGSTLKEVVVSDAVTCVVLFDYVDRAVSLECVGTSVPNDG